MSLNSVSNLYALLTKEAAGARSFVGGKVYPGMTAMQQANYSQRLAEEAAARQREEQAAQEEADIQAALAAKDTQTPPPASDFGANTYDDRTTGHGSAFTGSEQFQYKHPIDFSLGYDPLRAPVQSPSNTQPVAYNPISLPQVSNPVSAFTPEPQNAMVNNPYYGEYQQQLHKAAPISMGPQYQVPQATRQEVANYPRYTDYINQQTASNYPSYGNSLPQQGNTARMQQAQLAPTPGTDIASVADQRTRQNWKGLASQGAQNPYNNNYNPGATRTSAPTSRTRYSAQQLQQFRRNHGTAFDPKSRMDRGKMQAMFGKSASILDVEDLLDQAKDKHKADLLNTSLTSTGAGVGAGVGAAGVNNIAEGTLGLFAKRLQEGKEIDGKMFYSPASKMYGPRSMKILNALKRNPLKARGLAGLLLGGAGAAAGAGLGNLFTGSEPS